MIPRVEGDFHKPEFDDGEFIYITFLSKVKGVIKVKCKFQGCINEGERGIPQETTNAFNLDEGPSPEERINMMCKGLNSYRAQNIGDDRLDYIKQNKIRLAKHEIGNLGDVHNMKIFNNGFRRYNALMKSEYNQNQSFHSKY